jgi:hypothetical protein
MLTASTQPPTGAGSPPRPSEPPRPGRQDDFRDRIAERNPAKDALREARAGASQDKRAQPGNSPALVAGPNGAWIVPPGFYPDLGRDPSATPVGILGGSITAPAALSRVRVGGAPGAAQLHATIAEGRHAGTELRAIERNGRVAIELLAPSEVQERALRAELGEVRSVLAARGHDQVSVGLGTGQRQGDPRDQSANPRDLTADVASPLGVPHPLEDNDEHDLVL